MSFNSLLIHRAQIERRTGDVDEYGQRPIEFDTVVATEVPCRITRGEGGRVNTERSIGVFEVEHEIFFKPEDDAIINEDDLITVTGQDGIEMLPPARVKQKRIAYGQNNAAHHLEVIVLVQRGET